MPPVARFVELETFLPSAKDRNLSMEGGNMQSAPSQLCLEVLEVQSNGAFHLPLVSFCKETINE